ncbi:MAG: H(+)/Cl(-) exchange transporter ClcA [Candidatus Ordinivivax streblomastigis]|uniref:H(+)/Cl(-) exchange transporter ClcA n=1 Tax=Candidatus Ordinivivax streblomastigis TaxID=2540710 RepID=A0A5M8P0R5_9BACT|nr:MAG: H(+)/Cl(-) exchange transporter ClcA [Candidatus Ordinivivax streblomastigis]
MENKTWFDKVLSWREKHIKEQNFILLLSLMIGILTAVTAAILKNTIHFIQYILTERINVTDAHWAYLIYPIVGILLAGLFVKYIVKDDIGHGVTKILYAISQRKSRIKPHNTWTSVLASSITIGFGGSVGAEAPMVLTGSAIGSNLGRLFKMEQKTLMLLVGCGAAGAIAGIFKAPIAGLLFTIEVLMLDLTTASVLPLLISSVTAASVSYIFTDTEAMFKFSQNEAFDLGRTPYVLLLGIVCGLIALYFTRSTIWIEGKFRKLKSFWKKFALGATLLSVLIFFLPPLYGEGYGVIEQLLSNNYDHLLDGNMLSGIEDRYWSLLVFFFLIIVFKVFATAATNGGGGCGGIFAPSLFLGSIVGFSFAHLLNHFPTLLNGNHLPEENFALMGMAGVMASVMHSPLTAVFLIAELTGGFDLFLPLMIATISAYFTIKLFEKHSLYAIRLAQKGELLTHDKDKAVLTLLNTHTVIETDCIAVNPEMTLGDMVKVITQSQRNIFPVTDNDGVLRGVVLLDNIRNIMFRPELYQRFNVKKFMVSPPAKINISMPMDKIMQLFEDTKAWNLPVIDDSGLYLGFISKSKIFNAYREVLQENFSEDS